MSRTLSGATSRLTLALCLCTASAVGVQAADDYSVPRIPTTDREIRGTLAFIDNFFSGVTGTADEVAAAAGQHLRELEEVLVRLAGITGKPRSRIEDDLSAAEARDYGLIDAVVGDEKRGPS